MSKSENVLILGASAKPDRYAYKATEALQKHGHQTYLIGRKAGTQVLGREIIPSIIELPKDVEIDTVTVYLSADNQTMYEEDIIALKPKRVIFNPGAENSAFSLKLKENGILSTNACTLVMLSIGNF